MSSVELRSWQREAIELYQEQIEEGQRVSLCTRTINIHYGTYPETEIFSDFDDFENKLNNILDHVAESIYHHRIYFYNGEIVPLGPETINILREIYEEKSKPYRELNSSAKSARMRK